MKSFLWFIFRKMQHIYRTTYVLVSVNCCTDVKQLPIPGLIPKNTAEWTWNTIPINLTKTAEWTLNTISLIAKPDQNTIPLNLTKALLCQWTC